MPPPVTKFPTPPDSLTGQGCELKLLPGEGPVPVQVAAETVIQNYTCAHENAVKLKGWQDWAANMKALYGGGK